MSQHRAVVATTLGGALTASLIGVAGSAGATTAVSTTTTSATGPASAAETTHLQKALAHWKAGAAGTLEPKP